MSVRIFHLAAAGVDIISDGEFIHVPMRAAVGGPSHAKIEREIAADRAKLAAAVNAVFAERRRRASAATRERIRARHLARQRDRIAARKAAAPVEQTPPIPTPTPKLDTLRLMQPPPYVYRVGYVF